jgi:hypothetical protein
MNLGEEESQKSELHNSFTKIIEAIRACFEFKQALIILHNYANKCYF